jgi:hypothetical protein
LSTTTIVKEVRSHFMLEAINSAFGCPVIVVTRDPKAVFASLKTWEYGEPYLTPPIECLFAQPRLAHHFSSRSHEIAELGKSDRPGVRFASYFQCVQEYVGRLRNQNGFHFVRYEDFAERESLQSIGDFLGSHGIKFCVNLAVKAINANSRTTSNLSSSLSWKKRCERWREVLTSSEAESIDAICKPLSFLNTTTARESQRLYDTTN